MLIYGWLSKYQTWIPINDYNRCFSTSSSIQHLALVINGIGCLPLEMTKLITRMSIVQQGNIRHTAYNMFMFRKRDSVIILIGIAKIDTFSGLNVMARFLINIAYLIFPE